MLFSVDLKPESSEKCHRHRTGVLNRSNANYPCARGYSCGVRFPRPLPPSDPTECCRLCLLAPLRVSYHGQDVRPRANPTSAPVPLSPAELTVGQIRDVALGAARCMQFRIQNWLVLSAKFARNQFRFRESVEPKRCASSGSSLSRSTRSYAANHLAIAFFLTHFVAASEAAADNADIASWLKGMPKFSGLLRDYFIWQWEWSNWLGARYPELHLYLFGAAIVIPLAMTMPEALQIIVDRVAALDASLRTLAIAPAAGASLPFSTLPPSALGVPAAPSGAASGSAPAPAAAAPAPLSSAPPPGAHGGSQTVPLLPSRAVTRSLAATLTASVPSPSTAGTGLAAPGSGMASTGGSAPSPAPAAAPPLAAPAPLSSAPPPGLAAPGSGVASTGGSAPPPAAAPPYAPPPASCRRRRCPRRHRTPRRALLPRVPVKDGARRDCQARGARRRDGAQADQVRAAGHLAPLPCHAVGPARHAAGSVRCKRLCLLQGAPRAALRGQRGFSGGFNARISAQRTSVASVLQWGNDNPS